jgi:hypothetical protein
MNQVLERLIEESKEDFYDEAGYWINYKVNHKKLAELIVKECIKLGEDYKVGPWHAKLLADHYSNKIKKYFGIDYDIQ